MHTLSDYLRENRIRQCDFAAELGVTQATVSRIVRRVKLPSLELAFAIQRATKGAVPVSSWDPEISEALPEQPRGAA